MYKLFVHFNILKKNFQIEFFLNKIFFFYNVFLRILERCVRFLCV